jgi:hypothetical protein
MIIATTQPHAVFFWLGLIVLLVGRFHWLFREKSERGNFPTPLSSWVRFGSLAVTLILWAADLCMQVSSRGG